ncbi:hypothetical protein NIES2135_29750 [Leptolyngbya boryana NIES-2135]|jgi:hypothetical protein|uniref:Uncharacterized protein n=1 Tax=Leptolyngbya boryana NIES-2135 TaxID=1973484 RepID=A0A1Z4JH92_LEPBY|nr:MULTISPECIES: hypothetical protein [Leptolyngbya]BAY56145.1 hypothetical protein NIES2135_29750 [Leptolyngbya boryana NIES-2135]MBD2366254.1 hypothetical protein [Leptolyngbya sp. FACHB-161]MBD2372434.1 hypothetical protein [Leptolyngbya sp. FACHB-238]MBD2396857.1 hypothetical protein [Leptolyngbya sp. FACHB-239]MBD2403380.1 hypothetical protein [Leptolyngbya sp. FACHB-402]
MSSSLLRSIVLLSFAGAMVNPAVAETAPEVQQPVTENQQVVVQKEAPKQDQPVLVSQSDAEKPVAQKIQTRVPLSSRIFSAPSMQQ